MVTVLGYKKVTTRKSINAYGVAGIVKKEES